MKVFSTTLKEKLRRVDLLVLFCSVFISFISISTLAGAREEYGTDRLIIQTFAVLIGVLFMIVIATLDYQSVVDKLYIAFFIVSVLALMLTLVIGTGDGNKSWIRIPGFPIGIQPSEFIKLLFIITFSKHLDMVKDNVNHIKNILALCVHAGIILGLILLQGDLGTALVYVVIIAAMMFAAGVSLWYFLGVGVLGVILSPVIWNHLGVYQQQRILTGFNPELDPLQYGYQALMSKSAIAAGGFWGSGYSGGTQYKEIPFAHTDFIFAVTSEKFGFFGALIFFTLICALVVRIIMIARGSRKDYGAYICVGIAAVLIAQTVENIGMCLGMLPVIGITLPFMSYGGSSVFSLYLMMGVVLSIQAHRTKYFFERERT